MRKDGEKERQEDGAKRIYGLSMTQPSQYEILELDKTTFLESILETADGAEMVVSLIMAQNTLMKQNKMFLLHFMQTMKTRTYHFLLSIWQFLCLVFLNLRNVNLQFRWQERLSLSKYKSENLGEDEYRSYAHKKCGKTKPKTRDGKFHWKIKWIRR